METSRLSNMAERFCRSHEVGVSDVSISRYIAKVSWKNLFHIYTLPDMRSTKSNKQKQIIRRI